MKNLGFIRVAACSPEVKPADIVYNTNKIIKLAKELVEKEVKIALFPELSITGYTCADLFQQSVVLNQTINALYEIAYTFRNEGIAIVVGAPLLKDNHLYNCALIIQKGEIKGVVPKSFIPNYGEFYEKRWFSTGKDTRGEIRLECEKHNFSHTYPFGTDLIFDFGVAKIGIEICEDLWVPIPPSCGLSMSGADIILNLSATNELIGKHKYILDLIQNQSARCRCGYVYASSGVGESSTDLAFAGNCIVAENGKILANSERFVLHSKFTIADIDVDILRHDRIHFNTFGEYELSYSPRFIPLENDSNYNSSTPFKYRIIDSHPFVDKDKSKLTERCNEISSIQAWGLAVRLKSINCKKAVIGISGGLDSTLALLVTVKAFDMLKLDRAGIIGVTMPGFGTTTRTKSNASELMDILGVTQLEIPISASVKQHFHDIGHDGVTLDITYENSQARERTQILMDIANQRNGLVIGTGDLSELALGWCTYNGDQMSMYGVNASIPKTLVRYLVSGYAENSKDLKLKKVLADIIDTPISPELLPADNKDNILQKTEDLVGPYELHDFFMYYILRYGMEPIKIYELAVEAFRNIFSESDIAHWLKVFYKRFFTQQFKRSCMPDGIKAGSVCLSPRGDWRMSSDSSAQIWLNQLENLTFPTEK